MRLDLLSASLLLSIYLCAAQSASSGGAQDGVVDFSLDASRITLHEPVTLTLSIRNPSQQTLAVDLGSNRQGNIEVTAQQPDGSRTSPLRVTRDGFGRIGKVRISAGQTLEQKYLLGDWYEPDRPGKYRIEVRLLGLAANPAPRSFDLEVLPMNPARLQEVCRRLADAAIEGRSAVDIELAANALSSVKLPVAVPQLARVMHESVLGGPIAARGLGAIETPEAVDALISGLTEPREDTSAQARAALGEMWKRTHDPVLRSRIERALH
jgi:hypothetical protein